MRERIWLLLVVISLWGQAADGAESQRGVVQVLDADQKSVLLYGHSHALLIGAGNYTAGSTHGVRSPITQRCPGC